MTLLVIVLIPILLLGVMGVRMASNEQDVIKHQQSALYLSRLENVDSIIAGYFSELEKKILADSIYISNDIEKFARYIKEEPLVKNGIVFDADGNRVYPQNGKSLSNKERIFIEKSRMFQQEALDESPAMEQQVQTRRTTGYQVSKSFFKASPAIEKPVKYGWYTWFSGIDQNHIFWWKTNDKTFGVELFHARLISDIIILLPTTTDNLHVSKFKSNASNLGAAALIKLIDNNNSVIYQWGEYIPQKQQKYSAMLLLENPLSSWKLEYYTDKKSYNPVFNQFNILSVLIAIGAILGGLAYYLYREHKREIILGKQRVNFVSQISHELKTPLTNIRMYAELLEDQLQEELLHEEQQIEEQCGDMQSLSDQDYDSDPKYLKHIKIISSESQRLSRLIANILNFSKSTKSGLKIHKTKGEIDTVVSVVISKFEPLLIAKGFEFDIQLNARNAVFFDHDALEQILNNLLSNVEKYAASGKYLSISTMQGNEYSTITVQDKGPGIPASEHLKIFRPFYRISSRLTDGVSGTGIGLSIAKDLAILHGGGLKLVSFESGACFRLKIHTPENPASDKPVSEKAMPENAIPEKE
ncbi:MAG: sensor histidine kinase [Gammaproteobacteria bacterium]|nr:MAG: sensor histidine kinase [Gammaproteobacteria bacterium]